jgi:hypothetical protein
LIDLSQIGKPTGIKGVYSCTSFDPERIEDYRIPGRVVTTVDGKPAKLAAMYSVQSVGVSPRNPGVYYFSSTAMFVSYPGFACVWPVATKPVEEVRTAGDETITTVADPDSIPPEVRDGVD